MLGFIKSISARLPRSVKDRLPQSAKNAYYGALRRGLRRRLGTVPFITDVVEDLKGRDFAAYMADKTRDWHETAQLPKQPSVIEINNACNLNCVMCRSSDFERVRGNMDLGLFEEIVARLSEAGMRATNFHTVGDPLINKNLDKYLEILRKYKFSLSKLSSNCMNLHRQLDVVFEYRDVINEFRPSIDAASKATYQHIRVGGNWETLHSNLMAFADRNSRLKVPFPVTCNHAVLKSNFHELAYIPAAYEYVTPPENHEFSFAVSFPTTAEDYAKENYLDGHDVPMAPCGHFWTAMTIYYDGTLSGCWLARGHDLAYAKFDFGNGRRSSFSGRDLPDVHDVAGLSEAYNNDFMRGQRRAHLAGDGASMAPSCGGCRMVDPRFSIVLNSVIHYFYHSVRRHPVHLQDALNRIGPLLRERRFAEIVPVIESL